MTTRPVPRLPTRGGAAGSTSELGHAGPTPALPGLADSCHVQSVMAPRRGGGGTKAAADAYAPGGGAFGIAHLAAIADDGGGLGAGRL
jgi:hypothetical protein